MLSSSGIFCGLASTSGKREIVSSPICQSHSAQTSPQLTMYSNITVYIVQREFKWNKFSGEFFPCDYR